MLRVAVILLCLVPLFFTVEETDHLNKNKVLQDKTKDEIIRLSEVRILRISGVCHKYFLKQNN